MPWYFETAVLLLVTNSAKLSNIISGYGYDPALASMELCVEAAVRGRLRG